MPGGTQALLSGGRVTPLDDAGMMQAFDALARFCASGVSLFAAPYSERWGPDPERLAERLRASTSSRCPSCRHRVMPSTRW